MDKKPASAHKTKQHMAVKLKQKLWWIGFISFLLLALFISRLSHKKTPVKPLQTVVLTTVRSHDIPINLQALGTVTATYTVTVKSQVNGLLMKVFYKEGQEVKQGDALAEIDERPFLAQLAQYEGQLKRDEALLANALIDLKRYQTLWKQDSISQQTLATQEALVRQYQGSIAFDQGLIETTKVNLIYCHIISPIDGRLGLRLIDPGNFVQASDLTGLVVVTAMDPITVIFTLPEDDVSKVIPLVFAKKTLKVKAFDRQQNKLLATGTLLTIDNLIDTTTGTVKLRAQFDNKARRLFPNQFVNIKLNVASLPKAVVVKTGAIQHGRTGDFVYLLNPDSTVSVKPVETSVVYQDETVVVAGLSPGQQVVVEGADKLKDGVSVVG